MAGPFKPGFDPYRRPFTAFPGAAFPRAPTGAIAWRPGMPVAAVPVPMGPVTVRDRFNQAATRPQGYDETNITYGARRGAGGAGKAIADAMPKSQGVARNMTPAMTFMQPWIKDVQDSAGKITQTPRQADALFAALLVQESGGKQFGRDGKPLTSKAGAIGIAQVMPGTAPEAAKLAGLPWDPVRYKTDPAYNAALGAAYLDEKKRQNGGDPAKALAAYNAGQGRVNQAVKAGGANWLAHMPKETQNYVPSILGRVGQALPEAAKFASSISAALGGAYTPDFSGYDKADALLAGAQANANKPYSATYQDIPMPKLAPLEEFKAPDTSAGDAAFAAAAPKAPFENEQDQKKLVRRTLFAGMAQALASMNGTEGLGATLGRLGAGMLAGKMQGLQKVDDKLEEFDEAMRRYELAKANREDGKAAQAINVANQNIQARNTRAGQEFDIKLAERKERQSSLDPQGNLRTKVYNEDGTVTETVTPMDPTRGLNIAMQRANLMIGRAGLANQASEMNYRNNQSLVLQGLSMVASDPGTDPATQEQAIDTAIGVAADHQVTSGLWRRGVPRTWSDDIDKRIAHTFPPPIDPLTKQPTDYDEKTKEQIENFVKGWIVLKVKANNQVAQFLSSSTTAAASASRRGSVAAEKVPSRSTTTDAKGRTSVRVTE